MAIKRSHAKFHRATLTKENWGCRFFWFQPSLLLLFYASIHSLPFLDDDTTRRTIQMKITSRFLFHRLKAIKRWIFAIWDYTFAMKIGKVKRKIMSACSASATRISSIEILPLGVCDERRCDHCATRAALIKKNRKTWAKFILRPNTDRQPVSRPFPQ